MSESNKDNPEGNPKDTGGQAQGNQDQQVNTQDQATGSQPFKDDDVVELPSGEKVPFGELKKGYLKDSDYRQKTAQLAQERKNLELERQRREREANLDTYQEGDEPNPIQILDARLARMEAVTASTFLNSEIDKLLGKYPNADKQTVFKACWNNPDAIIEDEMRRDHERIESVQSSRDGEILTPEREAEIEKKAIEKYLAQKGQTSDASAGVATGEGSQTIQDPNQPPDGYDACKESLKKQLENQDEID